MSKYVPRNLRGRGDDDDDRRGANRTKRKPAAQSTKRRPSSGSERPAKSRPSPAPKPGAKPSPKGGGKSARRGGGFRQRRRRNAAELLRLVKVLTVTAVVATLLGVGVVVGNWIWGPGDHGEAAGKAAKTTAAALFSYDYRDFDASVENALSHAAGDFADQWKKTAEGLRETAVKEKAQVVASVVDVAVLNANTTYTDDAGTDYSGVVEVLTFMDQKTKNANIEGQKVDQSRVVLMMAFIDGSWKAVSATAV